MVVLGLAITFGPVDVFNDADGLQVYALAPPAVKAILCPPQMVSSGVTKNVGDGFTVSVNWVVDEHPFALPVTVYVVVDVGLAVTLEPVVALSDAAGLHV